MKPVNIYALTRVSRSDLISRLERQMSKRNKFLKVKEWETQGLRQFSDALAEQMEHAETLCFYYSFIMPKLGKEFDLLRISEKSVVNVELKSGNITDEAIRKQLLKNRYYLATLGKEIYSYTYISGENRLVKLTNSDRIQEVSWDALIQSLLQQGECYEGDIEDLFIEEKYLISPLSDPEHFLRREYFLTSQQHDIKKKILKAVLQKQKIYQGFTGLPGTGKSILLYDIAMELSRKKKVCILHLGSWPEGLGILNERLKRVDFYYLEAQDELQLQGNYGAILVDEGHKMTSTNLSGIMQYAEKEQIPVIFAYDREDAIAPEERTAGGMEKVEQFADFEKYQLTNRIRVNAELSSFVYQVMQGGRGNHRNFYPSVQLAYASTKIEAEKLLSSFRNRGYQYIKDDSLNTGCNFKEPGVDIVTASCMEFERVVMLIDESFLYDEDGNLRSISKKESHDSPVRNLYHGLNRAKKEIALVFIRNETVFERILNILSRGDLSSATKSE